jgi:hypothetical protein
LTWFDAPFALVLVINGSGRPRTFFGAERAHIWGPFTAPIARVFRGFSGFPIREVMQRMDVSEMERNRGHRRAARPGRKRDPANFCRQFADHSGQKEE